MDYTEAIQAANKTRGELAEGDLERQFGPQAERLIKDGANPNAVNEAVRVAIETVSGLQAQAIERGIARSSQEQS